MNKLERIAAIEAELEQLKKEIKEESEDYELRLEVQMDNSLIIYFLEKSYRKLLGVIQYDGKCQILSTIAMVEHYELWREKGMKVKENNAVQWKSSIGSNKRIYYINKLHNLVNDLEVLYSFESGCPHPFINDDNIVKFKHNNRPIIF